MDDESAFLTAILRNPFDDAPRLIYADWLDERGDPRGEYLRIECELRRTWSYTEPQERLQVRLGWFREQFDRDWIADVHRCTTPPPPLDVTAIVPEMKKLARTTVRLHPRQGEVALDASNSGGAFLWPHGTPWPRCEQHRRPFSAVLQLRKDEFPEIDFRPGADILQLMACPDTHVGASSVGVHAQWWSAADVVDLVENYQGHGATSGAPRTPWACRFYPERVTEYPCPRELHSELYSRFLRAPKVAETAEFIGKATGFWNVHADSTEYFYEAWLSVADGMKIGGYEGWGGPASSPKCSCGREMDLLACVPNCEWSESTRGRWLAIQDRNSVSADRQTHHSVQSPRYFGGSPTWTFYMCSQCAARPIVVHAKDQRAG